MAETRPALVLKGCGAVTTTLSHLVQSGDSEPKKWRLQLRLTYLSCQWKSESQNLLHQSFH